jgi:hypothetical protein
LIKEISIRGHEIASHSWRHEWIPLFTKKQVSKSLIRSKTSLQNAIGNDKPINGFVPPHNRPMTWVKRGAYSIGDRGLYPFFKMGDLSQLIDELNAAGYKWLRISHHPILAKVGFINTELTGRVFTSNGILILENHYTGFDTKVVQYILKTRNETYTISSHPLMLDFENKAENKKNFESFLNILTRAEQDIEFICPSDLL